MIVPFITFANDPFSVAGDHTRTIQIATPTVGGLMKFAVKTVTCLGCRSVLRTNKGSSVILALRRTSH
jgi:DNA polymerase delta subunit 1